MIKTVDDILEVIQKDEWMMRVLTEVRKLHLPDAWVGAGFVRSSLWDYLHGYSSHTALPDIDVIYFDPSNIEESHEKELEKMLASTMSDQKWSVKNQARMHLKHGEEPYTDATDALSRWTETATAVGVRLNEDDTLSFTAPHGVQDLINMVARPTPHIIATNIERFRERMEEKQWQKRWPHVTIEES